MRILSIHPAATELAFAIGAGDALIGRTDECQFPKSAHKLPSSGPMKDLSPIVIGVFEPEIVLAGPGQEQLLTQLKNVRTFQLAPKSIEDIYAQIHAMSAMLGKSVEGEVVVHELRTAIEHVRERSAKYKSVRVYLEVGHQPQTSASGYIAELLTLARATPFTGELSIEALQRFDPQIIISCAAGDEEYDAELIAARDGWQSLSAVKYERVFSIPGDLLHHPGPRMIEGVRALAKILHGISA